MTKGCSTVIAALPESSSTRQRRGCDVDSATAVAAWWKVVGAAALDSARSPRTWDLVTIANEEAAEEPDWPAWVLVVGSAAGGAIRQASTTTLTREMSDILCLVTRGRGAYQAETEPRRRARETWPWTAARKRMDLLEDLGFALDLAECDIDEEGAAAAAPESTDVLVAARRFQSGRSAAQQAYGDGKWRVGAGPMRLDWRGCVERMLSTASLAEREECVRALGTLAQVCRGACMVLVRVHA